MWYCLIIQQIVVYSLNIFCQLKYVQGIGTQHPPLVAGLPRTVLDLSVGVTAWETKKQNM